jgi:hypothetical protein
VQRTLSYRTTDDGSLLLKEHTVVFRLAPQCERDAVDLGVSAGRQVRLELLDDGGHLLDSLTYVVPQRGGPETS